MKKRIHESHYTWLDDNLSIFLHNLGRDIPSGHCHSFIVAHGDKCYTYRDTWKKHNIPFHHGVAIYLITYMDPWDSKVRGVGNGWVDPYQWVIDNYDHFKPFLPE